MGVLEPGQMYRPTDIAVDIPNEKLYVVEQFNHRISKWNFTPGSFDMTLDAGEVISITVTNGGTGYTVGDPVDISAPTLDIANPVNATAEVATETAGVINTITVTNGGSGYDPNNLPTVTATTGGSGAILAAVVSTPFGINGIAGTPGGAGNGGPTDTNLQYPTSIVLNSAGNLIISDTRNHRIRVMDSDGNFIESFGTAGQATTGGEFYRPSGIDVDNGDDILMIADEFNNRCQVYSSVTPYTFVAISNQPTGLPNLYRPAGVAYNLNEDVFVVSERLGNHLNEYEDDGITFTAQYGSAGTDGSDAKNSLYRPITGHGEVQPNADTPVADSFRNRIKDTDPNGGDTIDFLIGQGGKDATATVTIVAGVTTSYNITNGGTGYVNPPAIVLPPEAGPGTGAFANVLVTAGVVSTINVVDGGGSGYTDGTFEVSMIIGAGTGEGQLYQPNSVIGYNDGVNNMTVVANTKNNRIEVYEEDQYRSTFGSPFV